LAGRSPNDRIYDLLPQASLLANFIASETSHVAANHRASREIDLVYGSMYGVDFDGSYNIKPGLLESKRKSTYTGKEINRDRTIVQALIQFLAPWAR
jgi:hypothetical protein